jgi:hypothetical protein
MLSNDNFAENQNNPMDVLEFLVNQNEWPYERSGNDEIVAGINGQWCDFHMRYYWMAEENILQCAGQLEIRVDKLKYGQILELINLINERVDVGYFSIWTDDDTIMFRHALVPTNNQGDIAAQCDKASSAIISEINRYYPVFQFVIWGGKTPQEAIDAAMLETIGNA